MKKLLTILALVSAATFVQAQGTVVMQNNGAGWLVSTNGIAIPGGGTIGLTAKTALGFDYALLIANYGSGAPSSNPLDAAWSAATLTGVNYASGLGTQGGIIVPGGTGGAAVTGWGAPTGPNYTDATEKYFMVVGWSSNLGTTWAAVQANLPGMGWAGNAFLGESAVGFGFTGGGSYGLIAPSLYGVTSGMPGGLAAGFQLMYVPVPEPTTIALAGLGGLSLLLFRRRK